MSFLREIRLQIVRAVAELPDRTSPADRPEMMLVSQAELMAILDRCFDVVAPPLEYESTGELAYQRYCAAQPVDEVDAELTLTMLETWAPACLPANEQGQVHFARAMLDSAAATIRALVRK
ncbi:MULTISPECIES: hypothetical protein [unclassified Mesorhizobium]|uniref:hypothetical protein n=1 Tax=unclassified Mesorhizobium TaxID=325217 RepID=UPI00112BCA6F|nr:MULTISPECIES: hypothetical protein [unclassified Mesorhizobium]TPM06777.1 hypothetical protein FJ939_11985 [Mesorhizobium sp. B2-3-8]TPM15340.1 hypothetical protein FJ940_14120 [Mesorhizobium sp. B2-3-7]